MLKRLGSAAAVALFAAAPAFAFDETLPVPSMTGHFTLHTPDGRTVRDANFRGRWLLVYFGYTHCPDVCPTTLNEIGTALQALGRSAGKVQPVFITIDPVRDTPAVLKKYLTSFDPRIVGLRGDGEETEAAAKSFHVYYRMVGRGHGQYAMDHSGFLYLFDAKGRFVQLLSGTLPGHDMAQALRKRIG
jgi:protein SCO1/2